MKRLNLLAPLRPNTKGGTLLVQVFLLEILKLVFQPNSLKRTLKKGT